MMPTDQMFSRQLFYEWRFQMPYGSSSDDGAEIIAKLIVLVFSLIAAFLIWYVEFQINPSKNYSVEVRNNQIVTVEGLDCSGDKVTWQFRIVSTRRVSKYTNAAKLQLWERGASLSQVREIEVRSSGNLNLDGCEGTAIDVAYIWSISRSELYMHLRVHPQFRVYIDSAAQFPTEEDE